MVDFVRNKQSIFTTAKENLVSFPPELDVAYKMLRGLLNLKDGDLHNDRFVFLFDLNKVFVDAKPFFTILQKLAQSNAKFVLFSLAFIADLAFNEPKLLEYLRSY